MRAEPNSRLAMLAKRVSHAPEFFGALLAAFQQQEKLTADELSRFLRLRPQLLPRLALCRRPKSDSPEFIGQIQKIAQFTKSDPEMLLAMLRQVEALEALELRDKIVQINKTSAGPLQRASDALLAAARDKDSETELRKKSTRPKDK